MGNTRITANTWRHARAPYKNLTPPHPGALTCAVRHALWLLALTGSATLAVQPALAQAPEQRPAAAADAPQAARVFNIAAGPLAATLERFGLDAGILLSFSTELTHGLQSQGVSGSHTPDSGLRALLAGTGLDAARQGNGGYLLVKAPQPAAAANPTAEATLPVVKVRANAENETATGPVNGYVARRSATATKTDTPLMQTPQSVNVVTRDQIDAQGARSVSEALGYSAGVLIGTAGMQGRYDSVFVRGFGGFASASNFADYQDGLKLVRDARVAPQVDPWMLERVEVFRGPASVLYGNASPGGLVNMISKRPADTAQFGAFASVGSHHRRELGLDVSRPLNADGSLAARVVGLARDAGSEIAFVREERRAIAPSLRWRIGAATQLDLFASYQKDPRASDAVSMPYAGTAVPGPFGYISKSFNSTAPGFERFWREQTAAGFELNHRFDNGWRLVSKLRSQWFESLTQQAGGAGDGFQEDGHTILRSALGMTHKFHGHAFDNQLSGSFEAGGFAHTLLVGIDRQSITGRRHFGRGPVPDLDYLQPDYTLPVEPVALNVHTYLRSTQTGLYLQDQAKIGRLHLMAGLRRDSYREHATYSYDDDGSVDSYPVHETPWTGRIGALYLSDAGLATYAAFSTSFEPASGQSFYGQKFKATRGKQAEIGLKYQPNGTNTLLTAAIFSLTKNNVTTPDPQHDYFSLQTGQIRARGLELEAKASPSRRLDLSASYTFWDTRITRDEPNPSTGLDRTGLRPVVTPRHMASAWLDYHFAEALPGLSLGGGVRHVGATAGNEENTLKVPAYTLLDLAARYDFGADFPKLRGMSLVLNVRNATDRRYAASCTRINDCYYGGGRDLRLTLNWLQ